ncbi:MAG: DedA family protein [Acidobacteriota bacterium]|nr:DedA family protein [Acidobacteriota bacterium]
MDALSFLTTWRYFGAFIGIFLEEAGVPLPVPGDVFIAALGAAGSRGRAGFLTTTLVVFAAAMSGSIVLFEISRRIGHSILARVGHRFGYSEARARRIETWLNTHGTLTIGFGRLVPGFRILLTVAAGSLRMNRASFLAGVALASVLWATLYYWLGYFLGAGITVAIQGWAGRTLTDPGAMAELVTFVAVVVVAAAVMIAIRRRRLAQGDADGAEAGTDEPAR